MKFFTLGELGAEDEGQFHPDFLKKLDFLRHTVQRPFIVTSCARSKKHNEEVGGSKRSLHIWDYPQRDYQEGCMAIDLHVIEPSFKVSVAEIAIALKWSIGINDKKRFIHLDRRFDIGLPQAIFSY